MKTQKIIIMVLAIVFLSYCKKTESLLDIPFSFSTTNDFTLPKTADQVYNVPDSVVQITTPEIKNTIPEEFEKKNANINKLKSLTIEGVELTIKQPAGQTFGFMKSINVYLGATGKGEKLIASRDNIHLISPAPTTLSLTAANADIVDYIKGPTYYLKIATSIKTTYTNDILAGSEIKFKAVANPLN